MKLKKEKFDIVAHKRGLFKLTDAAISDLLK